MLYARSLPSIPDRLFLEQRISDVVKTFEFSCFDKDGFDLNDTEASLYAHNDIEIRETLNRRACQHFWLADSFDGKSGLRVDHSLIMFRYGYAGDLRKQIQDWCSCNVLFNKLLQVIPKYGLDVNLEYVFDDGHVLDLFHLEEDFTNRRTFEDRLDVVRDYLCAITADKAREIAESFRYDSDRTIFAHGEEENDYKAKRFGFEKAYRTIKVI